MADRMCLQLVSTPQSQCSLVLQLPKGTSVTIFVEKVDVNEVSPLFEVEEFVTSVLNNPAGQVCAFWNAFLSQLSIACQQNSVALSECF